MAKTVVVNKHHVDQVVADYSTLNNKPSINSVELDGNKTGEDLGLFPVDYDELTYLPQINNVEVSGNKPLYDYGIQSYIGDFTFTNTMPLDFIQYNGTKWVNTGIDTLKVSHGFQNRGQSTISINGSGVFTIQRNYSDYMVIYANYKKFNLVASQSVTVTDDQTITYIYFDGNGLLSKSTTPWSLTDTWAVPVAIVFKDGSTYALTDERHGCERNLSWHNWAHNNIGTMYKSGLTGTFTTSSLSVTQGIIYDEDIGFNTLTTKTTTSLWYRNATSGMRLVRGATACKSVSGGGVLQYDNGSGTLQDVSLNSYTTNWVYASNDPTEPIYTVIGQNNSNNLTSARNATAPTINLSTAEWKLIYKVIYQRTSGTPAGVFTESTDYRAVQTGVPTSSVITDHATLINRDASNSHPASAISYGVTDVNSELDARINKTYTLTIDVGEWTANSYAQVITGLTDNDLVLIQVPDSYYSTYGLSYTQSGNTITFTVTSTPLISLVIGIGMVKCSAGGSL